MTSPTAFAALPLSPATLTNLTQLGYTDMTPIQAASLPIALAGKDLIAQAQTGSGKTAAFALALLAKLNPRWFAVQAMVLCPTRELAAQVGGIGIAPGANLSDTVAMFEATHGTAPKYAGKDYVNPGSEILSAEMMLRHMGWVEAADLIISSMKKSINSKKVTYDFARLMDGATQVSCSGFGQVMIDQM